MHQAVRRLGGRAARLHLAGYLLPESSILPGGGAQDLAPDGPTGLQSANQQGARIGSLALRGGEGDVADPEVPS